MKTPRELGRVLEAVRPVNLEELRRYLRRASEKITEQYKTVEAPLLRDTKVLELITNTLSELKTYISKEGLINNQSVAILNRYKIIYTLLRLRKELSYFSNEHRAELEIEINIHEVERQISSVFPKATPSSPSASSPSSTKTETGSFVGKRQTIDTFYESVEPSKNIFYELMDMDFMNSGSYNQYEDWKSQLQDVYGIYNCADLSISDCSNVTQMLMHGSNTLSVPILTPRKVVRPPYNYGWDKIYKQSTQKELEEAVELEKVIKQSHEPITEDIRGKMALQNLKYELKHEEKEKVLALLEGFDFVEGLIDEHITPQNNSHDGLLLRDPQ